MQVNKYLCNTKGYIHILERYSYPSTRLVNFDKFNTDLTITNLYDNDCYLYRYCDRHPNRRKDTVKIYKTNYVLKVELEKSDFISGDETNTALLKEFAWTYEGVNYISDRNAERLSKIIGKYLAETRNELLIPARYMIKGLVTQESTATELIKGKQGTMYFYIISPENELTELTNLDKKKKSIQDENKYSSSMIDKILESNLNEVLKAYGLRLAYRNIESSNGIHKDYSIFFKDLTTPKKIIDTYLDEVSKELAKLGIEVNWLNNGLDYLTLARHSLADMKNIHVNVDK